ncbi:subclass B3 metallo-beta-lactamase [Mycobacteroides sp. LB1]|uniref:subclass B3 metallo-beta-lactamase n=1 Tax=Mycobacteroides sp. LB1 TaxID=2750814 RepID=UPI001C6074B8
METMKLPVIAGLVALTAGCGAPSEGRDQLERTPPTITSMAGQPEWTQPRAPIRVHGDTYYVGTEGISSVLIRTDDGLVLLDVGMPQSAPVVEENIRALGFAVEDVKYVLTSHTHYDHVGGVAAVVHDSGATAVSSPSGAKSLRDGHVAADDPQASDGANAAFPAVERVREVADGEVVQLGNTAVTAHFTPGHTPGGVSWTWKSCEGDRCLNMVYADSLNAVATGDFRITPLEAQFRRSIQTVRDLPCDILFSVHPEQAGDIEKLNRLAVERDPNPMIDPKACGALADKFDAKLDQRITEEQAGR